MADRIIQLNGIPHQDIIQHGFDWFLQDDYIASEAIELYPEEIKNLQIASKNMYRIFLQTANHIVKNALWDNFNFPLEMRQLIQLSIEGNHPHILGRFDFSGGIEHLPISTLEFNADTCTMLPETSYFQSFFEDKYLPRKSRSFNEIHKELVGSFKALRKQFKGKNNNLLLTSLGYEEDILNLKVLESAALEAGFFVEYADLEYVVFEADGVFLEFEEEDPIKFDFIFKLVPWEFIMYDEPELLQILLDLYKKDQVVVLNPPYCSILQSKALLPVVHELFPEDENVLPAFYDKSKFSNLSFVEKVFFGRMGENIKILDGEGDVVSETKGDFGSKDRIYQKFTPLYQDEEGDYYQAGIYITMGISCGLSFRRGENLIIDDDAEYIPHYIKS